MVFTFTVNAAFNKTYAYNKVLIKHKLTKLPFLHFNIYNNIIKREKVSIINCRKQRFRELVHDSAYIIALRLWTIKWSNKAGISMMYPRMTSLTRQKSVLYTEWDIFTCRRRQLAGNQHCIPSCLTFCREAGIMSAQVLGLFTMCSSNGEHPVTHS